MRPSPRSLCGLLDGDRRLRGELIEDRVLTLLHVGTSFVGLGRAPGCSRTAGADLSDYSNLPRRTEPTTTPRVDTDDLIDARGVAELLGLAHRNTVSVYQRRYPDMPRPVVDLGSGRARLWLRSEIERWQEARATDKS